MINEISVKLPPQFLIYIINIYFDENFKQLSIKSSIKVEHFEPGPIFDNNINYIKDNYLEGITTDTMNLSSINLFEHDFKQISMNISIEVEKFKPEPTFDKNINEMKDSHMKSIASATINI